MCSAKTLAGAFCYDYPHTEYLRHNAESSVDCLIKPDSVAVSKHVKPDSNSSQGKNILQMTKIRRDQFLMWTDLLHGQVGHTKLDSWTSE